MPRFALRIEYHGGPFSGWQRQKDRPSVQQAVEEALRRLEPGAGSIVAAGRTDAGVHATGQAAHCDLIGDWDPFRLSEALNHHLRPDPVAILEAARVPDDFHARFSATERRYLFRLVSRRAPATHDGGLVWRVRHPLDADLMRKGAERLIGRHDFTTFRSVMCQARSPVKTLDEIRIETTPVPHGIEFRFHLRARSFLHSQVRSIIGTLERVGAGNRSADDVTKALETRDRAACGPVCPPQGLYLCAVAYPQAPFSECPPARPGPPQALNRKCRTSPSFTS